MKYKIAGIVIDSDINIDYLHPGFNAYGYKSDGNAEINWHAKEYKIEKGTVEYIKKNYKCEKENEYKKFYKTEKGYFFVYDNNKFVKYSFIEQGCKNVYISIIEPTKTHDDMENIIRNITYALMDSFYLFLNYKDIFPVHSSGFIYDKKGLLISAPPGGGKSTHLELWKAGNYIQMIGDDVNACTFKENNYYIYGMPWCRKNNNITAKLDGLVFLEQGNINEVIELNLEEKINRLIQSEFAQDWTKECIERNYEFAKRVFKNIPCIILKCKPDKEAVLVLKKYIDSYW